MENYMSKNSFVDLICFDETSEEIPSYLYINKL